MPAKEHPCAWCDVVFTGLISLVPLLVISLFSEVPWWVAAMWAHMMTARFLIETR